MLNRRVFLKYWLPPLLWMAVIFTASTGAGSFQNSSKLLGPLLHLLFPHMSDDTVNEVVFLARKCCHLTEYAILGGLLWRAFRRPVRNDPRPWSWSEVRKTLIVVAIYASSDEIHQIFVPTRGPAIHDVVLDTVGGAMGLLLIWIIFFWSRKGVNNRTAAQV